MLLYAVYTITALLLVGAIYRLYLHPLAKFPGPKLEALTNLVQLHYVIRGRWVQHVLDLHEQYGSVVRVGPNEISYVEEAAWNDIYKARGGEEQLKKAMPINPGVKPALFAQPSDALHHELRKTLSPILSDRGTREREYILQKYISLFISKLRENGSTAIQIVPWYQAVTTDIVGCFMNKDQDFGCLARGQPHPVMPENHASLVRLAFGTAFAKDFITRNIFKRLPLPKYQAFEVLGKERWAAAGEEKGQDSTDDIYGLLSKGHDLETDVRERVFGDFVLAGTDTVAITLAGITQQLLINPCTLKRLQEEVRTAFSSSDQITLSGVNALKYQNAVIMEGLRRWPPGPETQRRIVKKGGKVIAGEWIPGGTWVGVYHWVAGRWSGAWKNSDQFVPERWLPENQGEKGEYKGDKRGVMQPFNVGPRNCVGQPLANGELRMILASLMWHFDVEIAEQSRDGIEDWMDVKIFGLIAEKKPLWVELTYLRS